MNEIEHIGRMLGKIISDFFNQKGNGNITIGYEVATQQLQSELDINLEDILNLSNSETKEYLLKRKLTAEHVDLLISFLKESAVAKINSDKASAKKSLLKCIQLLNLSDEISEMKSIERMNQKTEIENILKSFE